MNLEKRPLRPEDLFQLNMGSHPRLSPNGREGLWVVHRVDPKDNCYYSNLWLTQVDSGRSQVFTRGQQRDLQPVWSPDGQQIAFVSNRLKSQQVFLIHRHGGEAEVVTSLPAGS